MKIINFAHAAFVTVEDMPLSSAQGSGCLGLLSCHLPLPPEPFAERDGGNDRALALPAPLDAILATWGLGIVIEQIITLIFGREVQFVQAPITGTVGLLGVDYSAYRIVMIAAAIIVAVVFTALLSGTRSAITTRAVIMNEMLAQGLGVDSSRVRLVTSRSAAD